jgi:hypothetical protein
MKVNVAMGTVLKRYARSPARVVVRGEGVGGCVIGIGDFVCELGV